MNDDELVRHLRSGNADDNHRYAYVADVFGGEALLDSHLPTLDLIDQLAREWQGMDHTDERYPGLTYAMRVLAQAYPA